MGLFDKVKTILFDEVPEEVEVSVEENNLPSRKKERLRDKAKKESSGFIDYNEEHDEDVIKEVVLPKEETEEMFPTRSSIHSSLFEETPIIENEHVETEIKPEVIEEKQEEVVEEKKVEIKNYRELIKKTSEDENKKPFRVTPIISPVYGVIDDSSVADTLPERQTIREKTTIDKKRNFGPVSFNDEPLPEPIKYDVPTEEDELSEVNNSISDLINETIEEDKPKKRGKKKEESEIENAIEDAFEPTSEFDRIVEEDTFIPDPDEEPIIIDDEEDMVIGGTEEDKRVFDMEEVDVDLDNEALEKEDEIVNDDTIETDLFNLIDSMYKSDDSEV